MKQKTNPPTLSDYRPGATAIARTSISTPLKDLLNDSIYYFNDRIFHQGIGRPSNPDIAMVRKIGRTVVEYDPHWGPKDRTVLCKHDCDLAISIYVLNTLLPDERISAIRDLAYTIKSGGLAYIAVRSKQDLVRGSKRWPVYKDGWRIQRNGYWQFQRGYTVKELVAELKPHFNILLHITKTPAYTAIVAGNPICLE